ncbi:MAG: cation:proton antiporter [Planctomycetota bacterium]
MSEYQILTVLAVFAFLYSIVASRLEKTPISGAVIYLFAGMICGAHGLKLIDMNVDADGLSTLAELTLSLVLFADSATADLAVLNKAKWIPIRLLLIGLPLTIAAGFMLGYVMFDQLAIFEVALLATMLAPTDAALGQAVVTNESVPSRIRQSLNVESGLNDGICVPVLLVFLALASGQVSGEETASLIARLPLQAIGYGAGVGLLTAFFGSVAIRSCSGLGWISGAWTQVPVVALAFACFAIAQWIGGSGFIACFVGGMLFGGLTKSQKEEVLNGAEGTGNVLSLLTWFTFGAFAAGPSIDQLSWQVVVYAILSLTVVRMAPVMLCLIGIPMRFDTQVFLGWFGPRGLASIVFIVMVMNARLPGNDTLVAVVAWTVALSIIAHGISAVPFAKVYGRRVADRDGVE